MKYHGRDPPAVSHDTLKDLRRVDKHMIYKNKPLFVEVAVPLPVQKTFTYSVPGELRELILPGSRVYVPFGGRYITGIALSLSHECGLENPSEIEDLIDGEPVLPEKELEFLSRTSEYYGVTLGETLRTMVPPGFFREEKTRIRLSHKGSSLLAEGSEVSPLLELFDRLNGVSGKFAEEGLKRRGNRMPRATIARFLGEGILERVKQIKKETGSRKVVFVEPGDTVGYKGKRTEASEKVLELVKSLGKVEKGELLRRASVSASVLKRLVSRGALVLRTEGVVIESEERALTHNPETITLTPSQEEALQAIKENILMGGKGVFLLHGVTGSGKTEVYLRAIEEALTIGKSALYLIPEIALTPQLLGRVKTRFGENVAVFHSRVSTSVRHAIWGRVRGGETKLVIGARSAVFSPIAELGVIIVDEEHEGAYKQEEGLKYNGRDLSLLKGEINGATVVLGSATPSAETYFKAKTGSYNYLELPERVAESHLPKVEVIDLSMSRGRRGFKRYISERLEGEIEETLKRNETAMIFINRRGFSPSVMCLDCGFVEKCNNCSVSLTLHREEGALFCHYCGEKREVPTFCFRCKGPKMASVGIGTEKLLSFLEKRWKEKRVARMDSDSMRKKGAYGTLLEAIGAGEVDILVGTQMIAKGHDFPRVTMVGVVLADLSLSFPDFRASERTFQLLTQVAGRAGRRDIEGRVIIQTFQPDHYAVRKAATHDYKSFMDIELSHRSELGYPPFSRLLLIRVSGSEKDSARKRAREVVELLYERFENRTDILILGPSPAPIWKMKKRVTYQILVKSHPGGDFFPLMKAVNEEFGRRRGKGGLAIDFDVDPYQLMY